MMCRKSHYLEAPTIYALADETLECFEVETSHLPKAKGGEKSLQKRKLRHLSASTVSAEVCNKVSGMPLSLRKVRVVQEHHTRHQEDM